MALAELQFIDRAEAVHLIGPPGTGKTHLGQALGVEAVKAGRSVYFASLADIIATLARAEREGTLREKIRYFCRFSLLIVDEIGYLPVTPGGGNLFFQLVNARYEKGAMILTSNRGFAEWGDIFGDASSPRRFSTGFCTVPSSSKSRARAIACASTPTSCSNAFGQKPASNRRRSRRRSCAADDRPKTEVLIKTSADRRARQTGKFYFGASREIKIGIYSTESEADPQRPRRDTSIIRWIRLEPEIEK
jgi:hypothetical protein